MRYQCFLIGLFFLWLAAFFTPFFTPRLLLPVGVTVYVAIALAIGYSGLRYRSTGWVSGVLFGFLLLTFPLVISALYAIYQRWQE